MEERGSEEDPSIFTPQRKEFSYSTIQSAQKRPYSPGLMISQLSSDDMPSSEDAETARMVLKNYPILQVHHRSRRSEESRS